MISVAILLCSMETWFVGIASSIIGAVLVVFLLFFMFRPRIRIKEEIAIDKDKKLMFCFSNRSICPCVNVQASVKVVQEHDNADETEYKIDLEDAVSPYMSGYWSKEKDSEVGVVTEKTKQELPSHLRLIVTAQHAVSGIISVTTKDFGTDDAKEGTFEKGLFIPKGSDYGCTYIRKRLKERTIVVWTSTILVILFAAIFKLCLPTTWLQTLFCFIVLTSIAILSILLWLIQILIRANAFSSNKINKINLLMLAFGKEFPNLKKDVEDIEPDEERKGHRERLKRR